MKDFNILIHYNKLAISDEDNQFVSHYLEEGCKITAQNINEKYNTKFNIKIDYLCLEKGDVGIKQLFDKLDTYNDLIFTHAHVITKYQSQILEYLSRKKHFFFHISPPETLKNDISVSFISDFSECVRAAIKSAAQNENVLLSPACASFDQFNSFEERGKLFGKISIINRSHGFWFWTSLIFVFLGDLWVLAVCEGYFSDVALFVI